MQPFRTLRKTPRGTARLTPEDVRYIRRCAAEGWTAREIGRTFPTIAIETISKVVRGETWRNIPDYETPGPNAPKGEELEQQLALLKMVRGVARASVGDKLVEELAQDDPLVERARALGANVPSASPKGDERPPVSPLDEE